MNCITAAVIITAIAITPALAQPNHQSTQWAQQSRRVAMECHAEVERLTDEHKTSITTPATRAWQIATIMQALGCTAPTVDPLAHPPQPRHSGFNFQRWLRQQVAMYRVEI